VSDRVSQTILLCEDRLQASLVRSYTERCGLNTKEPCFLPIIASERVRGGNVAWVLREFPRQLDACRKRQTRANTLLILVADANGRGVDERYHDLDRALAGAELGPIVSSDPLVVLIPKRHIETWIRATTRKPTNETDDYKSDEVGRAEVRGAAQIIHGWAHDSPSPDDDCIPSLRKAFPEWRKIG
jgi:hypothetical protein